MNLNKIRKVMKQKIINFIKKNPVILIVAGVIAAVAIYFFSRKKKGTTVDDQTVLPVMESDLSRTEDELKLVAKTLFNAMNRLGTDEQTIFKVFKELNSEDIKFVFNSFGMIRYFGHGVGKILGNKLDLAGWLKKELSRNGEYSYDELKAIIEEKGVYVL